MVTRTHMSCTGMPAGRTPVSSAEVVVLDVDEMRLDVEQAVLAPIAVERDRAAMQPLARTP